MGALHLEVMLKNTHAYALYSFGQFAQGTEYRSIEPRVSKRARRLVLTGLATAISKALRL